MRPAWIDDLTHLTSEFELTRFKEDDLSSSFNSFCGAWVELSLTFQMANPHDHSCLLTMPFKSQDDKGQSRETKLGPNAGQWTDNHTIFKVGSILSPRNDTRW